MKITPSIEQVAAGIESWAQDVGWKTVGVRMSDVYQSRGGGKLIPPANNEQGIQNAKQRVKRIFSLAGPRYQKMADELADVALSAFPKEKRLELEEPNSPELATAKAMEAFGSAMSALTIRCPSATEKLGRALETLQALVPIVEQVVLM